MYAIFESNADESKCLAVIAEKEDAIRDLEEGKQYGIYSEDAVCYLCSELQKVGEAILH